MAPKRVLVARVGWMVHYDGQREDDWKPIGGGKYNVSNVGHEVFNFKVEPNDRCYGYAQPSGRKGQTIDIRHIDSHVSGDSIDGVTVIFVARNPDGGGQLIIGWYRDAIVYRKRQSRDEDSESWYYFETTRENAILLPVVDRKWRFDMRGRANIRFYSSFAKVAGMQSQLDSVLQSIMSNTSANLVGDAAAEASESFNRFASGQGYRLSAVERKEVEKFAMATAKSHLQKNGYTNIVDKSAGNPFDFVCTENGKEYFVEVKGTTTHGASILLTVGEVNHAHNNKDQTILIVVKEIRLTRGKRGNARCSGGRVHSLLKWSPDRAALKPVGFSYTLPV